MEIQRGDSSQLSHVNPSDSSLAARKSKSVSKVELMNAKMKDIHKEATELKDKSDKNTKSFLVGVSDPKNRKKTKKEIKKQKKELKKEIKKLKNQKKEYGKTAKKVGISKQLKHPKIDVELSKESIRLSNALDKDIGEIESRIDLLEMIEMKSDIESRLEKDNALIAKKKAQGKGKSYEAKHIRGLRDEVLGQKEFVDRAISAKTGEIEKEVSDHHPHFVTASAGGEGRPTSQKTARLSQSILVSSKKITKKVKAAGEGIAPKTKTQVKSTPVASPKSTPQGQVSAAAEKRKAPPSQGGLKNPPFKAPDGVTKGSKAYDAYKARHHQTCVTIENVKVSGTHRQATSRNLAMMSDPGYRALVKETCGEEAEASVKTFCAHLEAAEAFEKKLDADLAPIIQMLEGDPTPVLSEEQLNEVNEILAKIFTSKEFQGYTETVGQIVQLSSEIERISGTPVGPKNEELTVVFLKQSVPARAPWAPWAKAVRSDTDATSKRLGAYITPLNQVSRDAHVIHVQRLTRLKLMVGETLKGIDSEEKSHADLEHVDQQIAGRLQKINEQKRKLEVDAQRAQSLAAAKDAGMVNPQTDENGRLINSEGKLINAKGHLVDSRGKLINEEGKFVDETGHLVNRFGKRIGADGKVIKAAPEEKPKVENHPPAQTQPVVMKKRALSPSKGGLKNPPFKAPDGVEKGSQAYDAYKARHHQTCVTIESVKVSGTHRQATSRNLAMMSDPGYRALVKETCGEEAEASVKTFCTHLEAAEAFEKKLDADLAPIIQMLEGDPTPVLSEEQLNEVNETLAKIFTSKEFQGYTETVGQIVQLSSEIERISGTPVGPKNEALTAVFVKQSVPARAPWAPWAKAVRSDTDATSKRLGAYITPLNQVSRDAHVIHVQRLTRLKLMVGETLKGIDSKGKSHADLEQVDQQIAGRLQKINEQKRKLEVDAQRAQSLAAAKDAGMVNPQTDENGRLINSEGKLINAKGHLVDGRGKLINKEGKFVDETGHLVNRFGKRIGADGKVIKSPS